YGDWVGRYSGSPNQSDGAADMQPIDPFNPTISARRIHFRRIPSVNDGRSDMPDSGFAATSLLAGSPTSRIFGGLAFCSFSRLALGLDLLRSFAFCLYGILFHRRSIRYLRHRAARR